MVEVVGAEESAREREKSKNVAFSCTFEMLFETLMIAQSKLCLLKCELLCIDIYVATCNTELWVHCIFSYT